MLSRRKFLYAGAACVAGGAALGVDGFIESNDPRLVKIEMPLARLPHSFDGFTIAQLSDFHYEEHLSSVAISKAVGIVNQLRPDLVVLTGDFVTVPVLETANSMRKTVASILPCAELLAKVVSQKYAILGNHDADAQPRRMVGVLHDHGIPVLRNQAVAIERGGEHFWLAGIDDLLKGHPDLNATLRNVPRSECTILLCHEPDYAVQVAFTPVDLQLSGHSHGGQVWIPGIGAPWLPPLARKYPRGLYRLGKLILYTNIGIGTIRAPIRINCPPEITLITLRAGPTQNATQ